MKSFTEKPSVKGIEKQVIKEAAKESGKLEKHEKLEKSEKDKHEKEKHEKEVKEQKEQKEAKEKLEKEKHEKHEKQEKQEKEKHEKEVKDHKHEGKEGKEKEHGKLEQLEKVHKDTEVMQTAEFGYSADPESQTAELQPAKSIEKFVEKIWYFEKPTHKEFKYEKIEHKEWDKYIEIGNIPDPGDPLQASTEARLAALEANIAQLMHFIPENLRPDLSQGALKGEGTKEPAQADASTAEKSEPTAAKEADKGKKP